MLTHITSAPSASGGNTISGLTTQPANTIITSCAASAA